MMRESFLGSANLIVYQGRTNIFYETVDFLCIIGVLEEIREVLLARHQVHSLANIFQFPGNSRASVSALDPVECGLTVLAWSSSPSH